MKVSLTSIGGAKVRIGICVVAIAIAILNTAATLAGDPRAATSKAETLCAGCHGPDGISTNPIWPNLAGQKEEYFIKTMIDYRDGARQDPNMAALAKTLTEEEIEDLAAYYAALALGG